MPKQIKIGFDRVPAPVTKQFPQLVDDQGNPLFDVAGNPLFTEEDATLSAFARASNSMPAHVNNFGPKQAIPVEEQFAETSEVSTTLLGIPRAEEQLSLFSDVSTYGFDRDNWNQYRYVNHNGYPASWYYKENPFHGPRTEPEFREASNEQGLYLRSFPSQYGFSSGPLRSQDPEAEPSASHLQYMRFIAMGKYLYEYFSTFDEVFAKNFISDNIQIIDRELNPVAITIGSFQPNGTQSRIELQDSFYDIDYGDDEALSMAEVERWTLAFQRMIPGDLPFPNNPSQPAETQNFRNVPEYLDIITFLQGECRPGGSDSIERFTVLESKQSFRYQPGRISGFTFGIRLKADAGSNNSRIEWGASNETDAYLFQLRGSEFNIIRRSVLPLADDLLVRQGLEADDQRLTTPITLKNDNPIITTPDGSGTHYETVIPRSKMNGDPLNGEGDSRYFISFEDVTMFKIEFSWYGAIGAKFYAYIPVGNGEARWVLMHTLIIENGMGYPVLKNPEMKFSYLLFSENTSTVKEPLYVYKYGSSYYIDGGDEGTIRLASETSDTKSYTTRSPIMGLLPKNKIQSSTGDFNQNYKKSYPNIVNVSSDAPVRIDIEEVNGSPDGVHYHYSPSLHNGTSIDTRENVQFTCDTNRSTITAVNGSVFKGSDHNKHIIADGLYGYYINFDFEDATELEDGTFERTQVSLKRRNSQFSLQTGAQVPLKSQLTDGTSITPADNETVFTAKLCGYTSVAASTTGIYSDEFKIHFLNPTTNHPSTGRHRTEFAISVTDLEPFEDTTVSPSRLKFNQADPKEFNLDEFLHAEIPHNGVRSNLKGETFVELDSLSGERGDVDFRLPAPPGTNSGRIQAIKGKVTVVNYPVTSIEAGTYEGQSAYKISFAGGAPPITHDVLGVAEVGVALNGLGIRFISLVDSEIIDGATVNFVYVDGDVQAAATALHLGTVEAVQARVVSLEDDFQLTSYDANGSLRFGGHNFNYTKVMKFNVHPLYPVIAMSDDCRINNIIIEEIYNTERNAHTPQWLYTDTSIEENNDTHAGSANSDKSLSPSAFNAQDRLSGIQFDTTTLQPLRPGNVIYSFYVGADKPEKIDLSNVFNFDRKNLTTGILNNTALFFTASHPDSGSAGNVEMTVMAKEQ